MNIIKMLLFISCMFCIFLLTSNCFISIFLCEQGYPFHLVAIVTFWWTAENTFLEWVSCAVQLKCHMGNISQFWWNCTKWWLESLKSPSNSAGNLVQHFISLCKMSQPFLMNHHATIFPLWHGIYIFFVGICVFNSCYWAVIVSFLPLFAHRAVHFTSLLLWPFGELHKTLFLEWVSCAVQLKCHVGNISQFWWNYTKWWLEFPKSPSSSAGNLVQHFISLCKMEPSLSPQWHFILVELHKRIRKL